MLAYSGVPSLWHGKAMHGRSPLLNCGATPRRSVSRGLEQGTALRAGPCILYWQLHAMPCIDFHLAKLLEFILLVAFGTRIRQECEMEDPSGPAAFMESEGVDVPPEPAEDIPEDDWAEANEDGATGTEEEEGDAESYDTEDEDPIGDEVRLAITVALAPLAAGHRFVPR